MRAGRARRAKRWAQAGLATRCKAQLDAAAHDLSRDLARIGLIRAVGYLFAQCLDALRADIGCRFGRSARLAEFARFRRDTGLVRFGRGFGRGRRCALPCPGEIVDDALG